jgi:hypothetical protein
MSSMLRPRVFWLCLAAAACSGAAEAGTEHDAAHAEHEQDDFKGCPAEIPAFAPGLQAMGKRYSVKLVSAEPAEPERYENDWVVELGSAETEIVRAQTFMPVHGHDGRVEPELTTLASPDQWSIARLNFTMRGPWEVRLWLRGAPMEEDYAVFHVCVAK